MRRSTLATTSATTLAALVGTTLIGWSGAATGATPTPEQAGDRTAPSVTERERGVVLECTGSIRGLAAYVSLYENSRYGNVSQIVLGEDDPTTAGGGEPRDILADGRVRTSVRIDGDRAVVGGTAVRRGARTPVREVREHAGERIVTVGTHRRLAEDLYLTWRGRSVPLDCGTAFHYDLEVTRTPLV